jgi:hypothetical protein
LKEEQFKDLMFLISFSFVELNSTINMFLKEITLQKLSKITLLKQTISDSQEMYQCFAVVKGFAQRA